MLGLLVRGLVGGGHNRVDDSKGGEFFPSDRMVLDPVGFKLPGEPHVQSVVGLGVGGLPGVWEASQDMGRRNCPPCLRNRLLPKLVHSALGVLGVADMVTVDLKGFDARDR